MVHYWVRGHVTGSRVIQGANAHPPNGGQPAVLDDDAERDQNPVNAGLLTALLLASFLGTSAVWQLTYDGRQAASCPLCVPVGPSFEKAREEAPFLSVFRL